MLFTIFSLLLHAIFNISSISECPESTSKAGYELINQFMNEVKSNKRSNEFKLSLALLKYEDALARSSDFTNPEFFDEILISSPPFAMDTILNKEDFACIKEQVQANGKQEYLERKRLELENKNILKKDKLPERKLLFPGFTKYNIAWPLFSQDKKVAFLYAEQFCGSLCGSGVLHIYEVGPDKSWRKISSIMIYIS